MTFSNTNNNGIKNNWNQIVCLKMFCYGKQRGTNYKINIIIHCSLINAFSQISHSSRIL